MENRKQEETGFHNKLRDKELKEDIGQYKHLTSNKKFYSITRKSWGFVSDFLTQKCSGKRVLDYCCGNGGTTLFLAKHGARAIGIDISATSIQNARRKASQEKLNENASFFVMDAENLDFEDNYFDLVLCNGVLHHLDVNKAYPELSRVLKSSGKIICAEPLAYNPVFQLYRKITPHLRTEWEMHHILSKKEIDLAKKSFGKVECRFFHLASLTAVPFRNLPFFKFLLTFLENVDLVLLRLPVFKWMAWQIIFLLSEPKKYGTKKAKRN